MAVRAFAAARGLSLVAASRGSALASHCGGFSRGRARPVGFEGFCSCGCSTWDLPGPGIEPMSSALAGRFSTAESPGKSCLGFYCHQFLGSLVGWGKVRSRMDTERERETLSCLTVDQTANSLVRRVSSFTGRMRGSW